MTCPTCKGAINWNGDPQITECECSPCSVCEVPVKPEWQTWISETEMGIGARCYCPDCNQDRAEEIISDWLGFTK